MTEPMDTPSVTAAVASPVAQVTDGEACPVCATPGAWRGKRCVSCGVRFSCPKCKRVFTFDEVRTEHPCANAKCGHPHEVPEDRLVTRTLSTVRPLEEALEDWLRSGETGPAPTLRRGKFDLARAYGHAGNWRQAVELLDAAAVEPGDDPPGTELLRWRARALLANGDVVGAARVLLALPVAGTWDDTVEGLARALLTAVSADDAARLATWLESGLSSDTPRPAVIQVRGQVLDGALRLLAGDADTAVRALAAATEADLIAARLTWQALARAPMIAASLQPSPGNEAAALTLSARIASSLGYIDEASELVARVLDRQLTGDGYPEAEAYLLRGHDAARPAPERARDLLEAARRLGWRDQRPELLRSLQVAAEAAELDPTLQEAYWLWADNQRYAAYQPDGNVDDGRMRAALSMWDKGRQLGPPAEVWPRQVEAFICQDLAQFDTPEALMLAHRALRAASECALADPDSALNWVTVSATAYLLNLCSTAIFSADLSVQLANDSPQSLAEAVTAVIRVCHRVAPERVPGLLDDLARMGGATAVTANLRAIVDLRAGQLDSAKAALSDLFAKTPTDDNLRYWYMRSLVLSGDDATAAFLEETIRQTDNASATETSLVRAWALLWDGRAAEAADVISRLRQSGVDRLFDVSATTGLSLQAALLRGDCGEADRLAETLLPSLALGPLTDLDDELRWIEQQLDRRGDQAGSACASQIRVAAERAKASAPCQRPQDLHSVLGELERAICDKTVSPGERRAVSMAHLLISAHGRAEPDVADWLTPLAVELGDKLVPADSRSWVQWRLFTDIIPRMKARLQETTGLYPPAVRVRGSNDLGPLQFRVLLDGHCVTEGTAGQPDAVAESQATRTDRVDPALWQQVMDAVSETLSARPSMLCTPEVVGPFLADWANGTEQQQNLAERLKADREACIRLWSDTYAATLTTGRVPPWDSGLREITEATLGLATSVPVSSLPATAGALTTDQPAIDEVGDRGAGENGKHGGEEK